MVTAAVSPSLAPSCQTKIEIGPELAVIIPTFNERDNIEPLIARLQGALGNVNWEAIFVDDNSPDGTTDTVQAAAVLDRRIRYIRRVHRRGLAGACIEGMLSTPAKYIAVMDGDMQHDEHLLPTMLEEIKKGDVDLVVGTREQSYHASSGFGVLRTWISWSCNRIVRLLLGVNIQDPMSGFFMLRREIAAEFAPSLSSDGFKILLDILASARSRLRVTEKYYSFGARKNGESKLDFRVALDFIALVLEKASGGLISPRFLLFCMVGLTGLGLHMLVLAFGVYFATLSFVTAQATATVSAIGWNYYLNNLLTYRDRRRTGWRFVSGLLGFEIICGMGAISNIGIAYIAYHSDTKWWLAGFTGAVIGAVWNYTVSAATIWKV